MRCGTVMLLAVVATGCVSKGKYNDLMGQYDQAVSERDAAQKARDAAEASALEAQAKLDRRTEALVATVAPLLQIREMNIAKVRIEDGKAVLELDSDVLFASGSATLTAAGKKTIADIGAALAGTSTRFQVEGHTDSDPIATKTFPSNWHLGSARALIVTETLVAAGMKPENLSAASYGAWTPMVANDSPDHKKENRRIEIALMPELSELIPYKKLMQKAKTDPQ